MLIAALLLQAALPSASAITLPEAKTLSPPALAERLLPGYEHGPIVDAIVNGMGGLIPPSESVNSVWLKEQMVPFSSGVCRMHVFYVRMASDDPDANSWSTALPSFPTKVEEYDRLWMPPSGKASMAACAAAPPKTEGFSDFDLGLRRAAQLAEQARSAFAIAPQALRMKVRCRADRQACGMKPRLTLGLIDWSSLGSVEQVKPNGESYYAGEPKAVSAKWGPSHVGFTFPYGAGGGDTWVITISRTPEIKAVRMEAQTIIYE